MITYLLLKLAKFEYMYFSHLVVKSEIIKSDNFEEKSWNKIIVFQHKAIKIHT